MAGKKARRAINLLREQHANESVGKRHRRKGHDLRGVALDRFGETVGAPDYEGDVASIIPRAREAIRELTLDEIDRYVATGEPIDKAGAYAIQGRAAAFVSRLEGSYSGVMGLPLFETATILARIGVRVL